MVLTEQLDVKLSLQDLRNNFSERTIARGRSYARNGHVFNIAYDGIEHVLSAMVTGNQPMPYEVSIFLRHLTSANKGRIESVCTCPVGYNCKHAAATLFIVFEQQQLLSSSTETGAKELDFQIKHWLNSLIETTKQQQNLVHDELLFYIIGPGSHRLHCPLTIETIMVKKLKRGGFGRPKLFYPNTEIKRRKITPDDLRLISQLDLLNCGRSLYSGSYEVQADCPKEFIEQLIKTGRCHWMDLDSPALSLGPKRKVKFYWQFNDDSSQTITYDLKQQGLHVIHLNPLWYYDAECDQIGFAESNIDGKIASTLLQAPKLDPLSAKKVHDILQQQFKSKKAVPLPKSYNKVETKKIQPIPCLYIYEKEFDVHVFRYQQQVVNFTLADVYFKYGTTKIKASDPKNDLTSFAGNNLISVTRDRNKERQLLQQLTAYSLQLLREYETQLFANEMEFNHCYVIGTYSQPQKILQFCLHQALQLKQQGWQIEFDKHFPYQDVLDTDEWYAELDQKSEADWFSLELGINVNGERINLLPYLVAELERMAISMDDGISDPDAPYLLYMGEGRVLPIPRERMELIYSVISQLYYFNGHDEYNRPIVTHYNSSLLQEISKATESSNLQWYGGEKLLAIGEKLQSFAGVKAVSIPKTLNANLRTYQQNGVAWLQFLREYNFNGILADDMGLGKTIQVLTYLLIEKAKRRLKKPCLVIAPTSVAINWLHEAKRFAPSLKTLLLHGADRKQNFPLLNACDLVLTTYPLIVRDKEFLLAQEFYIVVLDEAQQIKNSKAKMTQIVNQLQAEHRLCLTGTPLENHLGELWSLFNFLMPGILGKEQQFKQYYRNPIEKEQNDTARQQLRRLIKPFILRRTKQEVVTELPEKTEIITKIEMSGRQLDLYETIRLSMHDRVQQAISEKGLERSHIVIIDALLKLRQVCCDPRLLKLDAAKLIKESAKLQTLLSLLTEMIEEGRRVLLFSQFTSMLALIEPELQKLKIDYVKLTGQTKNRQIPINLFQQEQVPLFLISLKAGGTGLNLTAADTVIHYDPWWNPAVEAQATDRAYRIGQDKPVFVYKLVVEGTVEEKILAMQSNKKAIADAILSGNQTNAKLSKEDLSFLFE